MKAKIKEIIGSLLLVLLPERAKMLSKRGVTLNFDLNKIDRIMSEAIIRKIENNLDYNNLAELHKNNWVNQGKHFFEITDSRFENDFLPNASFIFDILRKNLSGREGKFNTLVEIGTGSGSVLNYLSDKTFNFVNEKAFEGTLLAHTDGNVPNLIIEIPQLDEFTFGYLVYFFEKACAISGYLLGVNPFDQPGVEAYKKNMFALLGKPGFEKEKEELEKRFNK